MQELTIDHSAVREAFLQRFMTCIERTQGIGIYFDCRSVSADQLTLATGTRRHVTIGRTAKKRCNTPCNCDDLAQR